MGRNTVSFRELYELRQESVKELNEHIVALAELCEDFKECHEGCPLYNQVNGHCMLTDGCPNVWKPIEVE